MPNRSEALIPLLPERYQRLVELPTLEHALDLGPRLREVDLLELRASAGMDGTAALISSAQSSALGWTFLNPTSGLPQTMAGLGLMDGEPGVPWALSAPWDRASLRFFIDVYAIVIKYMHRFAPDMRNYVDARNRAAWRWLKRAGFEFGPAQPWGIEQRDFYAFSRRGVYV